MRVLVLLVCAALFCGCEGCGCETGDILARMVQLSGVVERDFAAKVNQWEPAPVGAKFVLGDGVRVKEGSGAILRMVDGSELHLKEKTQIRFLDSEENVNSQGIDVETGEAEFVVGEAELVLMTRVGRAVLAKNSRVRIRKAGGGLNFEVQIGKALVQSEDGGKTLLKSGDEIRVGIGAATLVSAGEEEEAPNTAVAAPQFDFEVGDGEKGNLVSVDALGGGIRLRRREGARWGHLKPGKGQLQPDTQVRVPKQAKLKVMRGKERVTLHGPGVYRIGQANEPLIRTSRGTVTLHATDEAVTVSVPGGRIVALGGEPGGTRAQVRAGPGRSKVAVRKGRVTVSENDVDRTLAAGEELTVRKNKRTEIADDDAERPDDDATEIDDLPEETGPTIVDFSTRAGESFIVHVAKPPAAIRFRTVKKCPGQAVLRLAGRRVRVRGTGAVKINVPRGRHRYFVSCVGEDGKIQKPPAAKGSVIVSRDSGRARLPRKAPSSTVDADGRKYRVIYQNLLPKISFRWRNAPRGSSYAVVVQKPGGTIKRFTTNKPEYSFASGKFRDGIHRLTFEKVGGTARRSKTTTLDIRFDNVAPKASIQEPMDHSFRAGQTVSIKGLAVPGWNVSVPGGTINLDIQHRFAGEVLFNGSDRSIAIRLSNPKRRVHYYIRRSGDGSN